MPSYYGPHLNLKRGRCRHFLCHYCWCSQRSCSWQPPLSNFRYDSIVGVGFGQHVVTQAPYGSLMAILAILLGTLPGGYGVPNAVCVLMGIAVIVLFVFFVCQPITSKTGKFDIIIITELYLRIKGENCKLHKLKTDTIAAWEHEKENPK